MDSANLKKLENRVDELIGACLQLKKENSVLKSSRKNLEDEHARLVEKTQIARTRIEAMIGRLKALERS